MMGVEGEGNITPRFCSGGGEEKRKRSGNQMGEWWRIILAKEGREREGEREKLQRREVEAC